MKNKYSLPDSVMNAVSALLVLNNLTPSQVELGMRLYSDGYEGTFEDFIASIKKLT